MISISQEDSKLVYAMLDLIEARLEEALDRTGEVGGMVNIDAPRLCREALVEVEKVRKMVQKAEDKAARAGDINKEKTAPPVETASITDQEAVKTSEEGQDSGLSEPSGN